MGNGGVVRLVRRAKKPLGEGAPAYGGRQSTCVQLGSPQVRPTEIDPGKVGKDEFIDAFVLVVCASLVPCVDTFPEPPEMLFVRHYAASVLQNLSCTGCKISASRCAMARRTKAASAKFEAE